MTEAPDEPPILTDAVRLSQVVMVAPENCSQWWKEEKREDLVADKAEQLKDSGDEGLPLNDVEACARARGKTGKGYRHAPLSNSSACLFWFCFVFVFFVVC